MRIRFCLCTLFLLLINLAAFNQSVYDVRFKTDAVAESGTYNALFVRYDDGTGLIRLKYTPGSGKDSMLVEMNVQEQYEDIGADNLPDNMLFYKLLNPEFIYGSGNSNFKPFLICFKLDSISGMYEPLGIISAAAFNDTNKKTFEIVDEGGLNTGIQKNVKMIIPFISVDFIDNKDLTKNLVLQYFTAKDDFYKNLFGPGTRGLTTEERNTRMILLAVANIKDSLIGNACLMDMNRMVESFREIAFFLGIKFEYITVSGNSYNKKMVEDAIKSITPNSNDIVVFYYSGHGFRKANDKRPFPYIDLRPVPDKTYMVNSLNMEDIFTSIKKKGARFNLVLSDCCNTEVTATNAVSPPIPQKRGPGITWSTENCRALFLNPRPMSVLATAADAGQRATSNNKFGGFFSYFFKESVENNFSYFKANVNWTQLLTDVKKQTAFKADHTYCDRPFIPANICVQYPNYKIQYGRF
jgi:hypothetical protein